jgi:hypothetical protein
MRDWKSADQIHSITLGSVWKKPNVSSLISPLNTNSVITYGDYESNNYTRGPKSSHGSINPTKPHQYYETADN